MSEIGKCPKRLFSYPRLAEVYQALRSRGAARVPRLAAVPLTVVEGLHRSERSFARCMAWTGPYPGPVFIQAAPELEHEPLEVIEGVLAHELGHAVAAILKVELPEDLDELEHQADRIAEAVLELRIAYDARDVQVTRGER